MMPTEISNDAASAARALHRAIEDNYDSLKQQCTKEAQLRQLKDLETAARDAFWQIQAKTFASDNLEVQTLTDQLNAANQKISDSLAGLKDIVQFLNFATEAVGLAASLAKLAAA
jgi:hypothetical protein